MGNKNPEKRKDELTCIQLSKNTKEKLDKLGTKKDTYEDIILRCIENPCVEKVGESQNDE